MNNAFLIFIGVFLAFGTSWYAIVKQAYVQLSTQQEVKVVGTEQRYPAPRSGLAKRGAEVYRQEGCYYCHSQRVRATGYAFNLYIEKLPEVVPLTPESEKLQKDVISAIRKINVKLNDQSALQAVKRAPSRIHTGVDEEKVIQAKKAFEAAGAKDLLGIELLATGSDIERGFGVRQNATVDYLHDDIVMPGSVRNGPDLTNVGKRKPLAMWHLSHLYQPGEESKMPSYDFLFEVHPEGYKSVTKPLRGVSGKGTVLVPSRDAEALAAYLTSLQASANLKEARAPLPPPAEDEGAAP